MRKPGRELFFHGALTLLLALLLGTGIYAWIYGDTAPNVSGKMKVGDTSGLVFEIDGSTTQLINLNETLGLSTAAMTLNEVSSVNGTDFLKRDTAQFYPESGNPAGNGEILSFVPAEKNEIIDGNQVGDYVHTDINLMLEYDANVGEKFYVYFLNGTLGGLSGFSTGFASEDDSFITEDGLKALRASVRVTGANEYGPAFTGSGASAFFANSAETAADKLTKAIEATEELPLQIEGDANIHPAQVAGTYYIDYLEDSTPGTPRTCGTVTDGMDVYSFDSFSIDGLNGLQGDSIPSNNYLFVLDSTCKKVQISLDLWLEGGSDFCTNGNIHPEDGVRFDMYLVAYKVTEPAE